MHLHQAIQSKVNAWREAGYPSPDYPAITEILEYATIPHDDGGVQLRTLRVAQLRALETYWYLRLVEGTPHIFDLYQRCYPRTNDLLAALGLDIPAIKDFVLDEGKAALWERIRNDTSYDGQVFDIVLSDVPERKDDLVLGRYELPAPDGPTTVAVKIIDMLGEEVLATATV